MSNHPTRLLQRLRDADEVEIATHDPAVEHKASQARLHQSIIDFVFWNGEADEIIEGAVTSCSAGEPFRFTVKRQLKDFVMQPKTAETARQERAQGGQPQAPNSGDPSTNAVGPHEEPSLVTNATEGSGMLPTPGEASDNDMAPGG
jgi:hypothetical protein